MNGGVVGAFFDLDGTLMAAPSAEKRFARYLLRRRLVRIGAIASWFVDVIENAPIGAPFAEADRSYLRGLNPSLAQEWIADMREPLPFFAEALSAIEWHVARAHRVVIVSGTLAPLARALVQRLPGRAAVCATELKTQSDEISGATVWTGQLAGEWVNGAAKARVLHGLAARHEIDLSRSFAYGDSGGDVFMLAAVGNPCAVNPSFRLRRIAQARRWRIERWRQEVRGGMARCDGAVIANQLESER